MGVALGQDGAMVSSVVSERTTPCTSQAKCPRTEIKFAEAEESDVRAQGHRAIPSPHPHLWELLCRTPFFDQKRSLQELIVPTPLSFVI